jgi:predicted metal-dependent hydrolase
VIDWLRRAPDENPSVVIAGRALPLAIRRHPRARRLTMRLSPDGNEVRVTLPRWGRTEDAMVFARARLDWLESQLAAVPQTQAVRPGSTVQYRGEALAIDWSAAYPRTPRLVGQAVRIGGPSENLSPRLQRWLEREAQRLLADDVAFYCARAGHEAPPLRLSRAQRRWGSCSDRRAIRINWRLVQAPDFVRRSVVAHEVAHMTHFDHSPAFHALLAGLFEGEIKAADARLKAHGRTLYCAFG